MRSSKIKLMYEKLVRYPCHSLIHPEILNESDKKGKQKQKDSHGDLMK